MTADTRFLACFNETESFEGWHIYSNDPYDPGGQTYSGVTQRVYDAYRQKNDKSLQSVKLMSDAECETIYRLQYWNAVLGDALFAGLDLVLYDIGVNSGPITAVKFLQQALGVTVDGQFGMVTLGKVKSLTVAQQPALIQTICRRRMSFWHSLSTYWRFGKGWFNRGVGIENKALAMWKAAS